MNLDDGRETIAPLKDAIDCDDASKVSNILRNNPILSEFRMILHPDSDEKYLDYLTYAICVKSDVNVVTALLQGGCSADGVNSHTVYQPSPLSEAAYNHDYDVMKVLLEAGADPDFGDGWEDNFDYIDNGMPEENSLENCLLTIKLLDLLLEYKAAPDKLEKESFKKALKEHELSYLFELLKRREKMDRLCVAAIIGTLAHEVSRKDAHYTLQDLLHKDGNQKNIFDLAKEKKVYNKKTMHLEKTVLKLSQLGSSLPGSPSALTSARLTGLSQALPMMFSFLTFKESCSLFCAIKFENMLSQQQIRDLEDSVISDDEISDSEESVNSDDEIPRHYQGAHFFTPMLPGLCTSSTGVSAQSNQEPEAADEQENLRENTI